VATLWLFKRIKFTPIFAYLFAVSCGPDLLALFEHPEDMQNLCRVWALFFLAFSLGLEFSLPKMLSYAPFSIARG